MTVQKITSVLVVQSGVQGKASVSHKIAADVAARIVERSGAKLVERDVAKAPFPHLDERLFQLFRGLRQPETDADRAALARSEKAIAELVAADVIVVGAPMYNFAVPSTLKGWVDNVTRVGKTFGYTAAGPKGLLPDGKTAVLAIASGGVYSEGPAKHLDMVSPHLRGILGFLGVSRIEEVRAEGLAMGEAAAAKTLAAASAKASALAASL